MHLANFKASGAELVMGEAKFVEPKTFEVKLNDGGTRWLRGERVFLGLGSRASIPPVPGLGEAMPLTHVEALELERVPEHLVLIGGGYVGLEFAQAMRRFGSGVTIIQRGKQLLDREDGDIASAVEELMRDEGIEVLLNTEILDVMGLSGRHVTVRVRVAGAEKTLEASDILVAAGRTPNGDRIDAAKGGVELDARGFIKVNERLQTSAADVWAVGDCAGSPHFTHVGEDDFRIVVNNLDGGNRTSRDRLIPYCLFTDPEVAHVGLSERDAKAQGSGISAGQNADGDGATNVDAVGNAGVRQSFNRKGRPSAWIYGLRRGGERDDGGGSDRDDGRDALHGAAGRDLHASDGGRGADWIVFSTARRVGAKLEILLNVGRGLESAAVERLTAGSGF